MFIRLDREYELKCTLGTIRDIEKMFGKGFFELIKSIQAMKTDEQIRLIFAGARRAEPALKEAEFVLACEEHLGLGELMELLEAYLYALQYPGLTQEEVQSKIAKKLEQRALHPDLTGGK